MRELPSGTVTLLFSDIEGSTRLLQELGRDRYVEALSVHRRLLREAFQAYGGVEVDLQGDSFHVAFSSAAAAVAAAGQAQAALGAHRWEHEPIRVRIGIHTGEPVQAEGLYAGLDVHRGARVMSAGHGGQVLLTEATRELLDGDVTLTELGAHRLKDLREPVRIYQLGDHEFPPLHSLSNTNLPTAPSPLVGRERELAAITGLIRDGTRLVTLTGPGGTGKTRLALEAAAELVAELRDGVFWVPLAAVRDPELVPATIEQTLGARVSLAEELETKELLLLLDNLEQVVDCAPVLSELLASCPKLKLLATSRVTLRIRGERQLQVPPLADSDAIALFRERAAVAEPEHAVVEICRRLDGLPLAIELAAARTRVLAPEKLLGRLRERLPLLTGGARDAPERQKTLRATIDWSYELLAPAQQQLFRRLGVFAGGFTLEAAEEVASADLDGLQVLVENSLVRQEEDRFSMLETIREYAVGRLETGEASEVRGRHALYYLQLVDELAPRLRGREQTDAFEQLDAELGNLRAAREHAAEADHELLVGLAAGLGYYLLVRGYVDEARRWGEVAYATGAGRASARVQLVRMAGRAAITQGAYEDARRLLTQAAELARETGDYESLANALRNLAHIAAADGDGEAAHRLLQEARALSDRHGDDWTTAAVSVSLADLALREARWEEAQRLALEGAARFRELGDRVSETGALLNAALAALRLGRLNDGRALLERAAQASGEDPEIAAIVLDAVAWLLADAGRASEAAEALGSAGATFERLGATRGPAEEALRAEAASRLRASLTPEALEGAMLRGRDVPLKAAVERALASLG